MSGVFGFDGHSVADSCVLQFPGAVKAVARLRAAQLAAILIEQDCFCPGRFILAPAALYKDMILELLNTLVPFTAEGFISYRGEEGDLWCHVFAGGEWTERSGRICYDEPRPQFEESKQNLERLIEEIRRQVIYDDRPYEDRARDLLKAFEAHDPDGVLLALSGRRLHEHGVAAGIWQDGGESAHPDERE